MDNEEDPPLSWRQTRELFAADHARLRRALAAQLGAEPALTWLHPGAACVFLFRVAHHLWRRGHRKSARLVSQLGTLATGGDFHPASAFGPGLLVPHPTGVALMGGAGRNLAVMSRSGTGMLPKSRDVGAGMGLPFLGDDCTIGPCCGIEGPQRVGSRVRLLTGVALMQDVPDDHDVHAAHPGTPGPRPATAPPRAASAPCPHASLRATLRDFVDDLDAYEAQGRGRADPARRRRMSALLTTQALALGLYRASHCAHAKGWPRIAAALARLNRAVSRATLNPASCVGGGWYLPHPTGVLFNGRAGKGLVLFAYSIAASPGAAFREPAEHGPAIGDGVVIAAHSRILGPVRIGDNVRTGFSGHVLQDIPDDRLVVTPGCRAVLAPRAEPPAGPTGAGAEPAPPPEDRRALLAADWARLVDHERPGGALARLALRLSPAWTCVWLFRASQEAFAAGRPRRAQLLWQLNMAWTGADMRPWSRVGPGLLVPYPACVSISAVAGRNLTVLAVAGLDPRPEDVESARARTALPRLGDDVTLEHHAGVVGPVRIGSGVRLTAGARVWSDVADGEVLVHAPVRVQRRARSTGPLSVEAIAAPPAGAAADPG